jgi:hypothetical protein
MLDLDMRYPPKYGLIQIWFMYTEDISLLFHYTRFCDRSKIGEGKDGLCAFVPPHGAIALLDPPANGAFVGVVAPIQERLSLPIFPSAIEGQARPEVPTVQKEIAQAIDQAASFFALFVPIKTYLF